MAFMIKHPPNGVDQDVTGFFQFAHHEQGSLGFHFLVREAVKMLPHGVDIEPSLSGDEDTGAVFQDFFGLVIFHRNEINHLPGNFGGPLPRRRAAVSPEPVLDRPEREAREIVLKRLYDRLMPRYGGFKIVFIYRRVEKEEI